LQYKQCDLNYQSELLGDISQHKIYLKFDNNQNNVVSVWRLNRTPEVILDRSKGNRWVLYGMIFLVITLG